MGHPLVALVYVDIFNSANRKTSWAGLLVSAKAAGASAAWNGVVKPVLETAQQKKDQDVKIKNVAFGMNSIFHLY